MGNNFAFEFAKPYTISSNDWSIEANQYLQYRNVRFAATMLATLNAMRRLTNQQCSCAKWKTHLNQPRWEN